MTIKELKARLAALKEQGRAIQASAKALDREMTDDELAKIEEITEEAKKVSDDLEAEQARVDRAHKAAASLDALGSDDNSVGDAQTDAQTDARGARTSQVQDRRELDPMRGFANPMEYLMAVIDAPVRGTLDERLQPLAAAGSDEQRGNSNPLGAFLLPEAMSPDLLQVGFEGDPTAGLVRRIPMQSNLVAFAARVDKDHSNSVSGGFRFYRRNQASQITSSRQTYEQVKLEAHEMAGLAFAAEELMQDSPMSFAAIIEQGFADEFGSFLLNEKINGTGVGEMEGVINSDATIAVSKETSQTADTIVGENIAKMRARCWNYGRAIWLANHDILPTLLEAHLSLSNSDIPLFRPSDGEDRPDLLFGRPIYFSEYCPTVGDKGDLILGVWSEYLFGDRQGPTAASSMHLRFDYNEMALRVTARNDGRLWWRSALTPVNSSTTLSPFVVTAARA